MDGRPTPEPGTSQPAVKRSTKHALSLFTFSLCIDLNQVSLLTSRIL